MRDLLAPLENPDSAWQFKQRGLVDASAIPSFCAMAFERSLNKPLTLDLILLIESVCARACRSNFSQMEFSSCAMALRGLGVLTSSLWQPLPPHEPTPLYLIPAGSANTRLCSAPESTNASSVISAIIIPAKVYLRCVSPMTASPCLRAWRPVRIYFYHKIQDATTNTMDACIFLRHRITQRNRRSAYA